MFKTAFEPGERVSKEFMKPTLTKQSFRDECDVNNVLRKYAKTGVMEHLNRYQGDYGDYSGVVDYQSCVQQVQRANDMFQSLPSKVRSKFANDPGKFLEFALDESNRDAMRELGLLKPEASVVAPSSSGDENGAVSS